MLEALRLFEYRDINEVVDAGDIKKRYRKLMRKYHPDLVHGDKNLEIEYTNLSKDINEAHEIILKLIKEVKLLRMLEGANNPGRVCEIIDFKDLFKLYANECVTLASGFQLTKSNIRAHNIILNIGCGILVNGIMQTFNQLTPWVLKDEYKIECPVMVDNTDPVDIIIYCHTKVLNITLKSNNTRLKLQFDNGVVLYIIMDKKFPAENKSAGGNRHG